MKIKVCTWGTGGAFGRELGLSYLGRSVRYHTATSIIGEEREKPIFHFLIDAGAPCTETMINKDVKRTPDVLFFTHPHNDHVSDFDKLVNSRKRGLGENFSPLPVICTKECLNDTVNGLKAKFDYLRDLIKWMPIPNYDVWYSICIVDGKLRLLPSNLVTQKVVFPVDFKTLPVWHAPHAPGSCLFIFRLKKPEESAKRIVLSGDFESMEDWVVESADLKDPIFLLLDTNTIKAVGTNHTNWEQNKKLIYRWITGNSKVFVLLHHIAGFEDYEQGYFDHIPTDNDWTAEIQNFTPPNNTRIEIAEDGKCYFI